MKREVAYLCTRANELEHELLALQHGNEVVSTSTSPSKQNSIVMSAEWQRLAKTQQQLRAASEAENWPLKRELQDHLAMTRCLAQTFGKRPSTIPLHALVVSKRRGRSSRTDDTTLFKDLVDDLDVAFRRLDSVFVSTGLDRVASEMAQTFEVLPSEAGSASSGTISRSCAQFVLWPKTSEFALSLRDPTVEKFAGLVLANHGEDMMDFPKLMENLLLDEVTGAARDSRAARLMRK